MDSIKQALMHGFKDRSKYGLLRKEQLYRRSWKQRVAWRIGWELANIVTRTPLRTRAGKSYTARKK